VLKAVGQMAGFCEGGNEVSSSIKHRNFLSSRGTLNVSGRNLLHGNINSLFHQIASIPFFWNMKAVE
jgi:hypothetical protein